MGPQFDSLLSQLLSESKVSDTSIQQRIAKQMAAQKAVAEREIGNRLNATLGGRGLLPTGGTAEQFRTEISLPFFERLAAQEGSLIAAERDRAQQARSNAVALLAQQAQAQMQREQLQMQQQQAQANAQQSQLELELKRLQLQAAKDQINNPQGQNALGSQMSAASQFPATGSKGGMAAAFGTGDDDPAFLSVHQRNLNDKAAADARWALSQQLNGWGAGQGSGFQGGTGNGMSSAGSSMASLNGPMISQSWGPAPGGSMY